MTFVDTNYFIRFLIKDHLDHFKIAKQLLQQAGKEPLGLISSVIVFFEIHWVLKSYYQKDKGVLVKNLLELLKLPVLFDDHHLLFESVQLYRSSNLTLEDCYNLNFAKESKVKSFRTFDQKLAKLFRSPDRPG